MKPKNMPSATAVKTYLDAHPEIAVVYFDAALLTGYDDYLYEVADQVAEQGGALLESQTETYEELSLLRESLLDREPVTMRYLLSTDLLTTFQNFEQTFHGHMVRLKDIPDDGNLGVVYVRDVNRRSYEEGQRRSSERGHWTIEPVAKVGRTNVTTTKRNVFDMKTGSTKDGYGHLQAYFSRRAMEDRIFDEEERWKIVDEVRRAPVKVLRHVAALVRGQQ